MTRSDEPKDLTTRRAAIEALDQELLSLLARRMEQVEHIAEAKLTSAIPFRDPLREDRILERMRDEAVRLGLDAQEIERLYRQILEMSIARQQAHIRRLGSPPLQVAYQGVEGSFSHLAAQQRYAERPSGVLLTGYETLREAVEAVRSGAADRALLPIENTTAGSVTETYDLLAEGGIAITAEVVSHVEHCLLALPGVRFEELRTLLSHPQALAQCEAFLAKAPWIHPRADFDTAGSARRVRETGDRTLGAIASESAARVYGLEVLQRGIQTQSGNFTRFVEVAREAEPCPAETVCKTSLVLTLEHRPGSLGEVLSCFGRQGVNLTRIESRPIPESPWQYRFHLDLEGHAAAAPVAAALEEVGRLTTGLRVLGTYARAESPG